MKLYGYWRSSTSYRVRIALALKELKADIIPVNLLKTEQRGDSYRALNPQMRVPTLIDGERVITQSLAIMEYLDEVYPQHPLLPQAPEERVHVREIALAIATDMSPPNNLGIQKFLVERMGVSEEQKLEWIQHWLAEGFNALEAVLVQSSFTGKFCHGSAPTMADCALVPQVYNARRFHLDMSAYPTIARIDEECNTLQPFKAAHPDNQPDAV
jgi:maleylacetoacetate isomerase